MTFCVKDLNLCPITNFSITKNKTSEFEILISKQGDNLPITAITFNDRYICHNQGSCGKTPFKYTTYDSRYKFAHKRKKTLKRHTGRYGGNYVSLDREMNINLWKRHTIAWNGTCKNNEKFKLKVLQDLSRVKEMTLRDIRAYNIAALVLSLCIPILPLFIRLRLMIVPYVFIMILNLVSLKFVYDFTKTTVYEEINWTNGCTD